MQLRQALVLQSPSLELQRAAAAEIAALDALVRTQREFIDIAREEFEARGEATEADGCEVAGLCVMGDFLPFNPTLN